LGAGAVGVGGVPRGASPVAAISGRGGTGSVPVGAVVAPAVAAATANAIADFIRDIPLSKDFPGKQMWQFTPKGSA